MPETFQRNGYKETEYGFWESYYGTDWRISGSDINVQGCGGWRSLVPWDAILDEPPRIFDRLYPDGTRKIGRKNADGSNEDLIWTIRPDGSATYSKSLISMDIVGPLDNENVCSMEGKVTKTLYVPPAGFPTSRYEFSRDGLKAFRSIASLYPNGFTDRSKYNEFPVWSSWVFPFEKDDSKGIRSFILQLHPADVMALYYTLLEYNGDNQDVYGGSSICKMRKFVSAVTPEEFRTNGFWMPYQEMLIRAIWDIRTDLHKVKDPKTGEIIDGIIDYRLFHMPCVAGKRGMIANIVAGIALGAMTLGAGAALKNSITAINLAKTAVSYKDQAEKIKAMQDFASKVMIGFNVASDPSNIINPLQFTERDLSSDPTAYNPQPVDDSKVSIGLLAGVLIGGYYLLS